MQRQSCQPTAPSNAKAHYLTFPLLIFYMCPSLPKSRRRTKPKTSIPSGGQMNCKTNSLHWLTCPLWFTHALSEPKVTYKRKNTQWFKTVIDV